MDVLVDGELILFGTVGENLWGEGFSARNVVDALAAHGRGKDITVRINSGGGYTADGAAIFNALKAHRGKVTTIVEAVAASAASVIFMAGDTRIMRTGSLLMIHDPSVITFGNKEDHEKSIEVLEELAESMADIYAEASGRSVKQVRKDMEEETWLTAKKAVDLGYATEAGSKSEGEPTAFNYTLYRNAPKQFVALAKEHAWDKLPGKPADTSATAQTQESAMSEKKPGADVTPTPDTTKPATEVPAATNVVDINTVKKQGHDEAMAYVAEVTEVCKLAGKPERVGDFIASKTSVADVRKALIDAKASDDAARTTTTAIDPNADPDKKGPNAVVSKAVAKINQRLGAK